MYKLNRKNKKDGIRNKGKKWHPIL